MNPMEFYRSHPKSYKKLLARNRQWRAKNPVRLKELTERWRKENPERIKKLDKEWRRKNPNIWRESRRRAQKKQRSTLKGNLDRKMSCALSISLKKEKCRRRWQSLVGYTIEDLRKHLESLFAEGMTWERFLKGEIHIDHKIPKARFGYTTSDDQQFKNCWSLDNLQPLWAKDNQTKNNRTMEEWGKNETHRRGN
jgi:hypothetical protein